MYKFGDYVFGHVKGHARIWPGVVTEIEMRGKNTNYLVDFFGSKKDKGKCTANKL